MKIDREKFLSALMAVGLTGAVACGGEEPPAAAEPEETSGEEVVAEPAPEPAPEPMAEPAPAPEPEPEVQEAGPTPE